MRRVGLALAAATVLLVTACTSGKSNDGGSSGSTPTDSSSSTSSGDTTASTPSGTSAPSQPPASTDSNSSSSSAPSVRACGFGDLTIGAIRGSGVSQRQYATLRFTNKSKTKCVLTGHASAQLYSAGKALGKPAVPSADGPTVVVLPGKTATEVLTGPSNCNAGVSDSVRITPPQSTTSVDRTLPMRGCALTIQAFKL